MKNNHWYDQKYPHDLEGTHVRVTMNNGVVVYGDLHDDLIATMSIPTGPVAGSIKVLVSTLQGIRPADGVKDIHRMWDGKVWRRRTEKDSGLADAIYVNDRLYTVAREEYDDVNNKFYEIVKESNGRGKMLQMRFPNEAVTERLMLVDGHPTDPGVYKGADGSLWCISRIHEYQHIVQPDYQVYERKRGDIPAEAYPLHRVSDL